MSVVESSFAIVAEPNRRAILSLLLSSERSAGEIERELRLSQPSVSKHLRALREAGFVESRIEAQRRLYRLRPEPLMELDAWLVGRTRPRCSSSAGGDRTSAGNWSRWKAVALGSRFGTTSTVDSYRWALRAGTAASMCWSGFSPVGPSDASSAPRPCSSAAGSD